MAMIVRTYQRRNRGLVQPQNSESPTLPFISQDSSQKNLPSSQESCTSHNKTLPQIKSIHNSSKFVSSSSHKPNENTNPLSWPKTLTKASSQSSLSITRNFRPSASTTNQRKNFKGKTVAAFGSVECSIDFIKAVPYCTSISTLMEAQESGEMMEHVDEANFALDGLRPGQPLRVRRASLVSLLSVCVSVHRRQLLRTHGMVKPLLNSIISLPTNDHPTTIAATALLYALVRDGQDENFLASTACIQFLLGLLSPSSPPQKQIGGVLSTGSKLLDFGSRHGLHREKGFDHGSADVISKVKCLLLDMKEPAISPAEDLNHQCLSLITLEKACLSTIMLEDRSGSVKKVGGNFKERLRELGGLENICEFASDCFLNLKNAFKVGSLKDLASVGLLLRCLKVLENVTFLSEGNQRHLLDLRLFSGKEGSSDTFIGLIIKVIELISEAILEFKAGFDASSIGRSEGKFSHNAARRNTRNESMESECSSDLLLSKGTYDILHNCRTGHKRIGTYAVAEEDSQDPFEFTVEDLSTLQNGSAKYSNKERGNMAIKKIANDESGFGKVEAFVCPGKTNKQNALLGDCLLSSVKVLMNLTNDNPIGCCQVATYGGLETMVSLVVGHCALFDGMGMQELSKLSEKSESISSSNEQESDLLVVVLGVLVNLVEKDHTNRTRLSNMNLKDPSYLIHNVKGFIDLLCLMFLSKEGAIETSGSRLAIEEAENMIVEAYTALLLGFLCIESASVRNKICQFFPGGNLTALVPVLDRFLAFHLSLNMINSETHAAVKDIIELCRRS